MNLSSQVTINPLEENEITYVPDSPPDCPKKKKLLADVEAGNGLANGGQGAGKIASAGGKIGTTADDDELRRCSIGSASSLTLENRYDAR